MSLPSHVGSPEWLTLAPDEQVRIRARPSKNLLLVTFVVGAVLLFALGVVAAVFTIDVETGRLVSLVVLVFVFVLTGSVYLLTRRREYVVTSQRVCEAVGLTSKEVTSVDADDVRDVAVEQSGWQARFDIGSLRFVTDDGTTIRFAFVENPLAVYERALDSLELGENGG